MVCFLVHVASLWYGTWPGRFFRKAVGPVLELKALRILYASLGSFAASALISVIGSGLAFYGQVLAFRTAAIVGLGAGVFAVAGLVTGCVLLVRETRVALVGIQEEVDLVLQRDSSPL